MSQPNKSTKILLAFVFILSIVLAVMLVLLLLPEGSVPKPNGGIQPEQTTQPKPVTTIPTETEPAYEDVQVRTGYCGLYYSGQWADSIRTERITEDFTETVLFYGTAEGKEALLFAVYFANATDNSFPVGVYAAENGLTVDVSAELFELTADGRTDEGFDLVCAMQEQVNYVIGKLKETDGFTPVQCEPNGIFFAKAMNKIKKGVKQDEKQVFTGSCDAALSVPAAQSCALPGHRCSGL